MTGHQLSKRLKKLGREWRVAVSFDARRGKGSHGRLYFGERWVTIKDRRKEIGEGLLADMLKELGLTQKDIQK